MSVGGQRRGRLARSLRRHVRRSSDAKHSRESVFITVVRPVAVELVGAVRSRSTVRRSLVQIGTFLLVMFSVWGGCSLHTNVVGGALCGGLTLMVLLASFGEQ